MGDIIIKPRPILAEGETVTYLYEISRGRAWFEDTTGELVCITKRSLARSGLPFKERGNTVEPLHRVLILNRICTLDGISWARGAHTDDALFSTGVVTNVLPNRMCAFVDIHTLGWCVQEGKMESLRQALLTRQNSPGKGAYLHFDCIEWMQRIPRKGDAVVIESMDVYCKKAGIVDNIRIKRARFQIPTEEIDSLNY